MELDTPDWVMPDAMQRAGRRRHAASLGQALRPLQRATLPWQCELPRATLDAARHDRLVSRASTSPGAGDLPMRGERLAGLLLIVVGLGPLVTVPTDIGGQALLGALVVGVGLFLGRSRRPLPHVPRPQQVQDRPGLGDRAGHYDDTATPTA